MATSSPTLVACTDLSRNSLAALRHAAWLSSSLGYQVRLIFVVDPGTVLPHKKRNGAEQHEALAQWAKSQLELLRQKIFTDATVEAAVIELPGRAIWGELTKPYDNHAVAQAICEAAKASRADLIVLGTHGHAGLSELVLGTVAMRVMRLAPCDVLTVRPVGAESPDAPLDLETLPSPSAEPMVRRMLCAVDFSEGSRLALNRAVALAKLTGAELHLLHSYRVPFWMGPGSSEMEGQLATQVADSLEQLANDHRGSGVTITCHTSTGRAPMQIRDLAEQLRADWIVMGALGQTALDELLVGSVTERVVRIASSPVLAVRNR
ncbi:MAG: universal stress protein [Myxococcales bacterium]|nr:universal stress protein [Myxococcales bacterium]